MSSRGLSTRAISAGRARKAPARYGSQHGALLAGALALFLIMPSAGFAEEPASTSRPTPSTHSEADPTAPAPEASKPVLSWEPGAGKSYSIPAAEIIGFDFLLNQFDRHFIDADEYGSNFSTFRHNLTHKWVVDNDPFATNQFLHPYQGSMYHGFARSTGLNYWESLGYAFAGSVLWETAGETGATTM